MKKALVLLLCAIVIVLFLSTFNTETEGYIPTGDGLHSQGQSQPTSSSRQPVSEQSLTLVYYPNKPLNPYQTGDYTNRVLFPLLYQGLFSTDDDYTPVPILCKSYTRSKNMRVYTFYIEDATFADGTALTAEDVAASLNAARVSPAYQGRLRYVEDIRVGEDDSVIVSLSISYENLPLLLDIPIVKASDVEAAQPMGTGPYYLEERRTGLQLTRRKDWWCNATLSVTASYIPLVEAQSNAQIRDQYEYGNIDLVCTDPGSDLSVDFRSDYELWSCENGIFLYLACNEKSQVFSDPALRLALTHAIDRDQLIEDFYRGFATAATLPASPHSPFYNRSLAAKYTYDPEVFREAVALIPPPEPNEDGTEPAPVTVTILVNKTDSRRVRVARAIAQMLMDCGLKATTSELSGKDYTTALSKGRYDLHLGQTTLSPNMDLSAFYAADGALNFGGLLDTVIYEMCQEAMANTGNYYTLHRLVMEDAMLCPILFRSYAIYTSRGTFAELDAVRDNLFFYTLGKTLEDVYMP